MRTFTTEILSARQEMTPEGYLLCLDVSIARTGSMLYLAGEVPVEAAPDGLVTIDRLPGDVFRDETIASFEGKAVTLDHPDEDVNPSNWSKLAKGVVQNVRRGSGLDDNFLIADLLITDAEGIRRIREENIREVSCGYDADYQQIAPGRGRQTNIVGNHVALVDKGRCGERCAIGDKAPMKKPKWFDKALAAFKARDEAEMTKALEEGVTDAGSETEEEKKKREAEEDDKKKTSDALAALAARILDLEKVKDAAGSKEETDEEKKKREAEEAKASDKKGRDAASVSEEAKDVFARVEILSPGMELPATRDAEADPAKFRDSLCALRRKALAAAFASPKTRDAVAPLVAGVALEKLTCDALSSAFIGASEIVRRENNAPSSVTFDGGKTALSMATTISEMNRRASEFWNSRK